ncbi:MAG: AsmA family protein [Desulfobulbaceae bacterium]
MGKTGKWILGTVAALVGLLILITLSLPFLIDPNSYKELIARKVQEQTGRQVSIPGDIALKVSPLGLKTVFRLGEVRLSSTPNFPDTELLTSRLAEVQLALWPLLRSKELQMNTIRLEGVSLNLIRGEDGSTNWGGAAVGSGKKPSGPAPEQGTKPASPLAAIDIGGVVIQDLNVSFADRQAGKNVKLNKLNLTIGRIRPGSPIPVEGDFTLLLDESGRQPLTASINARTSITFSPDLQQLSLREFTGTTQIAGGTLPVPELGLTLTSDLDLDLAREKAEIKKLVLRKDDMQAEAVLTISGWAAPKVDGTLRIPAFSPRAVASAWGITLPLTDPENLNKLAADLAFTYDPATLTITKLQLSLDDTSITGTAAASNLNEQPFYDLALQIDRIDLNRYGVSKPDAPEAQPPAGPAPPAAPRENAGEAPLLPVALLRGLNFNADLAIGSLQTGKLSLSNLKLKAGGKDGAITIAHLSAGLYDGTITVNGEIDARPDIPKIHLAKSTKGIQLGPLFRDLSGKEEMTGRADINADLTTRGLTRSELTRNSNGTLNLAVADGEIAKLRIIDTIRTARTLINVAGGKSKTKSGTAASSQPSAGDQGAGRPTNFANLTASGVLTNGVFRNEDLQAESELMRVTGKGTVDLVNERIDYLLTIYLAKAIDRNEQTGLVDLADTPIPYRVKGSFDKIEQSAALEEIVKSEAKKVLVKELEKRLGGDKKSTGEQKDSGGSTEELIQKGLKGLFGR